MDQTSQEIVDRIKERIIRKSEKTPFLETRLGVFLSTDWIEYFIDKMAYKMYLREKSREYEQPEEKMEVVYVAQESEYLPNEENINDHPQMIESDEDGNHYYTYPNDIVEMRKPKYVLTSIFPSKEIQDEVMDYLNYLDEVELDNRKKKLFASHLGLSEEEITQMSWESIDEAILNKYIRTHRWKRRTLEVSENVR